MYPCLLTPQLTTQLTTQLSPQLAQLRPQLRPQLTPRRNLQQTPQQTLHQTLQQTPQQTPRCNLQQTPQLHYPILTINTASHAVNNATGRLALNSFTPTIFQLSSLHDFWQSPEALIRLDISNQKHINYNNQ